MLYTKWYKVYTKTNSWFQKSHEEFGQLQTSSRKSKKLKFDGLVLSKKYIPSAKTFYITKIYLTLLSPNCVKIHQITYVIFETKCHFYGATPLYFVSSSITYFLQK